MSLGIGPVLARSADFRNALTKWEFRNAFRNRDDFRNDMRLIAVVRLAAEFTYRTLHTCMIDSDTRRVNMAFHKSPNTVGG